MKQEAKLTPNDMVKRLTGYAKVIPLGSAEAFKQKRLEENISWMRAFYDGGGEFVDSDE